MANPDDREQRDRPRCGAAPRPGSQRTEPCKRYPIRGGTRCPIHGGASPQAKAKATERLAEQEAGRAVARFRPESTPVADPLTELSKLAGEVLAWKCFLADRVQELNSLRYSTDHGEAVRGEVLLFERALDRCAQVLGLIAKLNIDERLARISEAQAERITAAFLSACDEVGLTVRDADRREAVAGAFTRNLEAVG